MRATATEETLVGSTEYEDGTSTREVSSHGECELRPVLSMLKRIVEQRALPSEL